MNDDLLLSDCHRSIRTSGWMGVGPVAVAVGMANYNPLLFSFFSPGIHNLPRTAMTKSAHH